MIDPAILDYYDRTPEETRLAEGASVLDVGAAAGPYALWLAEHGYTVHLVDAVPRLVAEARRRSEAAVRPLGCCGREGGSWRPRSHAGPRRSTGSRGTSWAIRRFGRSWSVTCGNASTAVARLPSAEPGAGSDRINP